jgi:succinoglycan biosynthesis transport protein ExoP
MTRNSGVKFNQGIMNLNLPNIAEPAEASRPAARALGATETDLSRLLGIFKRQKGLIAAIIVGAMALGILTLFVLTPLYTVKTSILLDPKRDPTLDIGLALSGIAVDFGFIESEVLVIGSFNTARRVVEKLGLGKDPEFGPSPEGLLTQFLDGIRRHFSKAPTDATDASDVLNLTPETRRAIDKLMANTVVRHNGFTYVVDVFFTFPSPVKAAEIANAIADAYLVDRLEARYNASQTAIRWLDDRLAGLKSQLEVSERAVADYHAKYGLVSTPSGTVDKQQISELNAQLAIARAKTAETKAKFDQYFKPGSQTGRSNLQNEYEAALKREKSLEESLEKMSATAGQDDAASIKLHELEREADANRQLYENFLAKFKQAREATTLEEREAHVITPALSSVAPTFPRLGPVLSISFVLGLFAGIGAALVLDMSARGFQTSEQIDQILDCPTLAFLPHVSGREIDAERGDPSIIAQLISQPFSRFAEGIRSIRASVVLSNLDLAPKIIMVCSTVPGEGKSTIASSIAISAGQANKQVLLIDMDLRNHAISDQFNLKGRAGLVELLSGASTPEDTFERQKGLPITILLAGQNTTNPADIIASQKMARLLEAFAKQYDLIVLDCPPLFAVSDGLLIAKMVDSIVYVIEWNRTARGAVQTALKSFGTNLDKLAGVVLNKVNTAKLKNYSYYRQYYGKRYDQYYGKK